MRVTALLLALLAAGCTVDGGDGGCLSDQPPARRQAAAVLVPTTNQLYVYGGITNSAGADTLWRFRFGACNAWSRWPFDPASTPDRSIGSAAAYDSKRHRIVYPGITTWALDTDSLVWKRLNTVGNAPTLLDHSWAIYDPDHDRVVAGGFGSAQLSFAGSDQGTWQALDFLNRPSVAQTVTAAVDTTRSALYAYDGAHGGLFQYALFVDRPTTADFLTVTGDPLPLDPEAHLGWDLVDERLLLFAANGDVYRLDASNAAGDTLDSHRLAVTGELPPTRAGSAFGISGTFALVFGGADAHQCALDDTWSFAIDDSRWTALGRATTCP